MYYWQGNQISNKLQRRGTEKCSFIFN